MALPMHYHQFLKQACPPLDLEWRKYRRRDARRRIEKRIRELGLADYAAYLQRLRSDPNEAAGLCDRMRVTVSRFFRERERWEPLTATVLPQLLMEKSAGEPLKLWSAGCCGGEEPYTLALIWLSEVLPRFPGRQVDILATDIDGASLERAREGLYDHGSLRELPRPLLRDWFEEQGEGRWRLAEPVKQLVRFARHHLLEDPPPQGIDLVCCRYLAFTYFRGRRRLAAAERLATALRPGGALMIARKEELGNAAGLFTPWTDAPGVFRKQACACEGSKRG